MGIEWELCCCCMWAVLGQRGGCVATLAMVPHCCSIMIGLCGCCVGAHSLRRGCAANIGFVFVNALVLVVEIRTFNELNCVHVNELVL